VLFSHVQRGETDVRAPDEPNLRCLKRKLDPSSEREATKKVTPGDHPFNSLLCA
jgi:hypothetical protein